MVQSRQARHDDMGPIAGALARAFHDDPVMIWMFGGRDGPRRSRLTRFMGAEARRHHRHGGLVLTADGHPGAALWDPPGMWRTTWPEVARAAPMLVRCIGPRVPRVLRGLAMIERAHPGEPHWYLAVLGTDPSQQGRGTGAAMIEPVIARCDEEVLGAYLESSKPDNVPYYERFGFRTTGQIDLPGGPPLWPMWRDPR